MADDLALVCVEAEDPVPLQMEFPPRPHSPSVQSWESGALDWFSSLPASRRPVAAEVEAWLDSTQLVMPEALGSLSRPQLHQRILALHESRFGGPSQVPLSSRPPERAVGDGTGDLARDEGERGDGSRARFQRAEHWNPVYAWLESLETDEVVGAKQVKDWFLENPDIKENLSRNSRYHLLHYIQRVHMKILRRKGRSQKGVQTCKTRTALRLLTGGRREYAHVPCNVSSNIPKENNPTLLRKNEAFLRYRLLTDLQNHLVDIFSERSEGKSLLNTHLAGSTTASPI